MYILKREKKKKKKYKATAVHLISLAICQVNLSSLQIFLKTIYELVSSALEKEKQSDWSVGCEGALIIQQPWSLPWQD